MRLVFAGTPQVAVPALDAIEADGRHEIVAVLTRPDAPAGRGRNVTRSPVAEWADERGIEVLAPPKPGGSEFLRRLAELDVDCVPVVAYGALVPQAALDLPLHGWVNLHFSLLPAWRGAAPVQHAIWHGDDLTGASVFRLEAGLDTGPVFGSVTEVIRPSDTAGDLLASLAHSGSGLLVDVLHGIATGTIRAVPQPAEGISFAPKISVADAQVVWSEPAFAVDRRIRACTPAPGAWTTFRGERVKLGPVTVTERVLASGVIEVSKNDVYVGTGTTSILLGEVRAQGKKAMAAGAWARGVRIEAGETLA